MKGIFVILFMMPVCGFRQPPLHSKVIMGKWQCTLDTDSIKEFTRCDSIAKWRFGFEVQPKGQLLMRENIRWCGQRPITYGDYPGIWKMQQDSVLTLEYQWRWMMFTLKWKMFSISDSIIKIRVLNRREKHINSY